MAPFGVKLTNLCVITEACGPRVQGRCSPGLQSTLPALTQFRALLGVRPHKKARTSSLSRESDCEETSLINNAYFCLRRGRRHCARHSAGVPV